MQKDKQGVKRLVVSGGPGIGKSTLVSRLERETGMVTIDEGVRTWLVRRRLDTPNSLINKTQIQLQTMYLRRKMLFEAKEECFISDRSVLDGIVIARRRLPENVDVELEVLLRNAYMHAINRYEMIVIPPCRDYGETDNLREVCMRTRISEHKGIEGLAEQTRVKTLMLREGSVASWVRRIMDVIEG